MKTVGASWSRRMLLHLQWTPPMYSVLLMYFVDYPVGLFFLFTPPPWTSILNHLMLASFFLKDPPSYQVTIQDHSLFTFFRSAQITDVGPVGIHGGAGQLTSLPPSGKKPPQHHSQRIKTTTSHPRHQCTSRNLPATTTNTFLGWIFVWVWFLEDVHGVLGLHRYGS
ncbi:uncharacterized protein LOC111896797 [Lactuca sativa]|uniref:uncharacterized protein LOC111896797 n=1 Tax=Lactuca sativa TaxID=4236 RepID=UPI000CD9D58C|nr:uncharacterized protein LOC111896797 [Lactuca sativa]